MAAIYGRQWVFGLGIMFVSVAIQAAEVDYSVSLIYTSYDNINLDPVPAQKELSTALTGSLSLTETTAQYVTNLFAELVSTDYKNNITQDENTGSLFGDLLWIFHPGQFEWFTSDTFSQARVDILEGSSPDNRQNANAFSTGPNYYIRLNSRNNLNLTARLEEFTFEVVDTDNTRGTSSVQWEYRLNTTSTLSLNYAFEAVRYDNNILNSDFDRNDVFFTANFQKGRNTLELEAGVSNVLSDRANDSDASTYRVALQNERTSTSNIRLEFDKSLTDNSSSLQDLTVGDSTDSASSDVFVSKTSRLIYSKTLSSGDFNIDANVTTDDYLTQIELDQKLKGTTINVNWNLARASSLSLGASYLNRVLPTTLTGLREDDNYLYRITYRYTARRNIIINLDVETEENISTEAGGEYEDVRIFLSLIYSS
jgi:hypothetical protein